MLFFLQKGLSGLVDVACADGQDQVALLRSPAEIGRDLRERLKVDAAGNAARQIAGGDADGVALAGGVDLGQNGRRPRA